MWLPPVLVPLGSDGQCLPVPQYTQVLHTHTGGFRMTLCICHAGEWWSGCVTFTVLYLLLSWLCLRLSCSLLFSSGTLFCRFSPFISNSFTAPSSQSYTQALFRRVPAPAPIVSSGSMGDLVLLEVLLLQIFPLFDLLLQQIQPDLSFTVVLLQLLGWGCRLERAHMCTAVMGKMLISWEMRRRDVYLVWEFEVC